MVVHLPAVGRARGPTSPSTRLDGVRGAAGAWSQIRLSNRKRVSARYTPRVEADCEVGRRDGLRFPAIPATETSQNALEHLFKESESVEAFETLALRMMVIATFQIAADTAADRGSPLLDVPLVGPLRGPDHMFVKPVVKRTHRRSTWQT